MCLQDETWTGHDGERVVAHDVEAVWDTGKQPATAAFGFVVEDGTLAAVYGAARCLTHVEPVHPTNALAPQAHAQHRRGRTLQNLGADAKVLRVRSCTELSLSIEQAAQLACTVPRCTHTRGR